VAVLDLLEGIGVVVTKASSGRWILWVEGVAHEVTGMSPQSMTFPQKLNGLDFMGLITLVSTHLLLLQI
jgi:hypothetical protein